MAMHIVPCVAFELRRQQRVRVRARILTRACARGLLTIYRCLIPPTTHVVYYPSHTALRERRDGSVL